MSIVVGMQVKERLRLTNDKAAWAHVHILLASSEYRVEIDSHQEITCQLIELRRELMETKQ